MTPKLLKIPTTLFIILLQCHLLFIPKINAHEIHLNATTATTTAISLKNDEFLSRKIIPDIQQQLNDKKFENLNTFLMVLWNSLKDYGYQVTKDVPFTIIVPKVDTKSVEKERLKEFLLEHLVPGISFLTFNEDDVYGNGNRHKLDFKKQQKGNEMQWSINNVKILRMEIINEKLSAIFIDGFLGDKKGTFSKRNIQETNRYNEPQRLEMKNTTKHENTQPKENRIGHLMTFLAGMKSGTKVFQHFLSKSNLSQSLDGGPYTVLIPTDNAFQRWHPIDWGFYPFSVQEFTENVLRNHFLQLKTPLRMEDIKRMDNGQKYKTLGGETIVFKSLPTPTVNNVTILSDYTLPNGNEVLLISEVLFVSEAVVSRLHQMHRDKETPPLLAFPWFGAQFLSHSFLALERDNRFTQITRFLNTVEIAPFVSGSNYTFFVPMDTAFEKLGFDILPDDVLASENGMKMLLNHFIKGRLYDRDLRHDEVFETVGGGAIKIQRTMPGNVTVNNARIVETEIFVYNLGTMFYIDNILYSDLLRGSVTTQSPPTTKISQIATTTVKKPSGASTPTFSGGPSSTVRPLGSSGERPSITTTSTHGLFSTGAADVESVPSEFTEPSGTDDDFLLDDDEIVTPRALPVQFNFDSPKK